MLVDIANEMSSRYDITIFTIYGNGELEKELSEDIKLVSMNAERYDEFTKFRKISISLKLFFKKKAIFKKFINNHYDVQIAFLEGPVTRLFSVHCDNAKKIAWVHNDIKKVFGNGWKARLKGKLDKKYYSEYNNVVFVSEDNKEIFMNRYNIDVDMVVIPNYISTSRVLEKAEVEFEDIYDNNKINFLTVARLTEQKAIDRLIRMHKKLIEDGYEHNFYILGNGPEKEHLISLIKEYGVSNTFKLIGKRDNPYPYIKNCDVFALLSLYEGLPMTVLESRILNKPVLITNTAAREAVKNYDKCYITDNTEQGVYDGIKHSIDMLNEWDKQPKKEYCGNNDILKQIEKLVSE